MTAITLLGMGKYTLHNSFRCNSDCTIIERGYKCPSTVGEACYTTCGDGIYAGLEYCDDGNINDDDGCYHDCTLETGWICS